MDPRDPRCIAYERERGLRPDWRRWYPPGFKWPDEREAERKRAELAARQAEEAAWFEAQEAKAEAIARLRWMLKDLKVELMLARLRQKYSPTQPRVPAGNRDGGQWTGSDGGSNSTSRMRSCRTCHKNLRRRLTIIGDGPMGQQKLLGRVPMCWRSVVYQPS